VALDPESLDQEDYRYIRDVCLSEIGVYALLMIAVTYNTYCYLIKQRRLRVFTLTSFYVCATLLIAFRVT
jgi:hypothetical protein